MRIGCPIIVNLFLGATLYLFSTSLWERLSDAVLELVWSPKLIYGEHLGGLQNWFFIYV